MPRGPTKIDWDVVDEFLEADCYGTEIAGFFGIHPETFYRKVKEELNIGFEEYSQNRKATGDAVLKRIQYLRAIGKYKEGDNTLLIWLGKVRLKQKENGTENHLSQDVMNAFAKMMSLLKTTQEERKIEDNSISSEPKSA